jgi:hypothetical protein
MDLKGSGYSLIEIMSRHFSGETEEKHETLRILGAPAEIVRAHLLNTGPESYSRV